MIKVRAENFLISAIANMHVASLPLLFDAFQLNLTFRICTQHPKVDFRTLRSFLCIEPFLMLSHDVTLN